MKHFQRLRRSLWLMLALVIVGTAAATAVAMTKLRPADLTYTPKYESQVTNIDVTRAWIKNYYGAPTATTGASGTWSAPLNLDGNYAKEARSVAKDGKRWIESKARSHSRWDKRKKAIVLDVDDSTLTTWNYELFSNWDYNPSTNAVFVGLTGSTFTGNMFPATPGMVETVKRAKDLGYAIFFLTGRGDSQHAATIANLVNDTAAGFSNIDSVTYSGATVPEIDAGYAAPTPIDTGHGGFADGLFTKPSIGSYPAYLDTARFCAPYIHASPAASCPTVKYKSGTRAYIESQGYKIVANFGDQFSDLEGGFAERTFKLPNPNYYLP